MKLIFHCVLLGFLAVIDSAVHGNLADNLLQYLKLAFDNEDYNKIYPTKVRSNRILSKVQESNEDYDEVKQKQKNEKWAKKHSFKEQAWGQYRADDVVDQVIPGLEPLPKPGEKKIDKRFFHMDPVLNSLRRRRSKIHGFKINSLENFRRAASSSSNEAKDSSSIEMKRFKDEFAEYWKRMQFQAMNVTPKIVGDRINMIGARPWGVPCGDPNQHDMPSGSCMLPVECEADYRIYRGDVFCGRTQFVCCSLLLATYDTEQPFDVSFTDKSLSTETAEHHFKPKGKEKDKQRKKARKKRHHDREKRKKRMKKHIKKIITEIRKILNKQYKNGTKQRKKRTKQLKKFVTHLKKEYKKTRNSVKDLHEIDIIKIDTALMQRLTQIKKMNTEFVKNATFREIVTTGTMTMKGARMLLEAYPDLKPYLTKRRAMEEGLPGGGRRAMGLLPPKIGGELEYDIEYGYLYY